MSAARTQPAFLFDLDGTLIDSVYQHVVAWREALEEVGIGLSVWKIHRRIGMSGGLFVSALAREVEADLDAETLKRLPRLHDDAYIRHFESVRPLPGARELLAVLSEHQVPWAIATSGARRYARLALELLALPPQTPLITREDVRYAKPDPDLFLTAAERIGVDIRDSTVVGDSVWDLLAARRARALGIGLQSGGYGREELIYSGAFRVYEDPADLLRHLDEVGVRRPLQPHNHTEGRTMDEAKTRNQIEAHAHAVVRGDMETVTGDFAPEMRPHIPEIAKSLPQSVTSAEVLSIEVGEDESVAMIRYVGDGAEVTIRSRWREVDGRPSIVGGEPVQ